MLERNRFHGERNKTQPWPRPRVQWADTSPRKYFSSLSHCHSYTFTLITVMWALPSLGLFPSTWRPKARSGKSPCLSPWEGRLPALTEVYSEFLRSVASGPAPEWTFPPRVGVAGPFPHCSVKSWRACRVLSSQEKSLTDAHGKVVSGVLQEAMS